MSQKPVEIWLKSVKYVIFSHKKKKKKKKKKKEEIGEKRFPVKPVKRRRNCLKFYSGRPIPIPGCRAIRR